jgi:hypothetical protein
MDCASLMERRNSILCLGGQTDCPSSRHTARKITMGAYHCNCLYICSLSRRLNVKSAQEAINCNLI